MRRLRMLWAAALGAAVLSLAAAGMSLAAVPTSSAAVPVSLAVVEATAESGAVGVQEAQAAEYVGSSGCRRCHIREYRSWQQTRHAQVFELLRPGVGAEAKARVNLDPDADYTANEFCLKCHTVGYGEPTGFVSEAETPDLVGVGCEFCHGAGGDYTRDDVMGFDNRDHSFDEVIAAGLVWPVPEVLCLRCHGEETPFNELVSPEYAFEYTRDSLGEPVHVHRPLRNEHGPLPAGVLFQDEYAETHGRR